ncbi:LacI family DNA-binding transcriptional regulator [Asticcacaulis sp. AC460]|uniref:LacI family DNA-binding transcriptional regulator n=1 Tax=Asticcacaulis sp. AC460 TaxID=1282360 RepID=UPI00040DD90E|nr:LacI family DNA-binding transcriptional regulator [Asticcacaulis sp. AC460]
MANLTLDDLAKRANVSAKTISRVVNKLPGVGAKKRAEIEKLIAETGFRPNFGARVLASSRTYTICMVVEDQTSHYYFSELQIGISRACISAGYHLIVEPVRDVLEKGKDAIARHFAAFRPDGLIVVPPVCEASGFTDALTELNLPFVCVAPVEGKNAKSYVEMDDELATYEITRHLIDLGHRELAWLSVSKNLASMGLRESGFLRALREAGIDQRPEFRLPPPPEPGHGHEMAYQLLTLPDRPTALVCGNDSVAMGSIAAAQRAGLVVPRDVSVVGFDDSPASESCWPPLTTIHQPISAMGQRATEILLRHLDRDQPVTGLTQERVQYALVHRHTTAPPASIAEKDK